MHFGSVDTAKYIYIHSYTLNKINMAFSVSAALREYEY
jgi:hypothetical protein